MSSTLQMNDAVLAGVPRLLQDLQTLLDTHDHADILFLLGREETAFYAHRLLLNVRCKTATFLKRAVLPGSSTQTIRLPNHKPDNFRTALFYLYTGKVLLDDQNIFEMWSLCQDLNLEELKHFCEEHITRSLNVTNACTLLASALAKEDHSPHSKNGNSNPTFVERCIQFIGDNASECFQTPSFLRLSKDALIRLVSSDHLALEEVEIWRAVLSWARHQANVSQSNTQLWNQDERQRVCQSLGGVINHVRLLLIDSQVFAEEVEPTGAVPMEVSLERYRLAALPANYSKKQQQQNNQQQQQQQQSHLQQPQQPASNQQEDKRLQPRVPTKAFANSQILNRDRLSLQNILNQWYTGAGAGGVVPPSWKLAFRASQHDFSATEFHRICDGIAPLYIIILGHKGQICGGFTDVPWMVCPPSGQPVMNKGRYIASDRAFLFSLVDDQGQASPQRFDITKKTFAICYHGECGPIFGAGADLYISDQCHANMDSYSNLPHSYDGDDASPDSLMGDYNFSVIEYEVYTPLK